MIELTRYELAWLLILGLAACMFAYCVVGAP